ncbi:rho GTPase-activating protein 22 isoform X9 [Castor canadensis]|uniref:Rho GTPase-activating protein 22 isoform X9 n=1 Tax=Castor canadensis TaxID=51338 RepID=A0AC58N1F1_CASCN
MLPTASSKRRTFAARYFTRSKSLVMGEQNQSPGRPPGPRRPGPVLKAGWLRKQRSIMKNWQQRWFVLRGDQLFYYKDKDETKPQGFISLQGTQVTELLPGPEDLGKHLFEISPDVPFTHYKNPGTETARCKSKQSFGVEIRKQRLGGP